MANAKQAILLLIAEGPEEETVAARLAGVPKPIFEQWKREDGDFAAALKDAFRAGTDTLASFGLARAKRKSDRLMEFFLKARDPERYGENGKPPLDPTNLGNLTLAQLGEFLAKKRDEERLLVAAGRIIEGTAIDVTPQRES